MHLNENTFEKFISLLLLTPKLLLDTYIFNLMGQ